MPFAFECTRCAHPLAISDAMHERAVGGEPVPLRCRACGAPLLLDGRAQGSPVLVLNDAMAPLRAARGAQLQSSNARTTLAEAPPQSGLDSGTVLVRSPAVAAVSRLTGRTEALDRDSHATAGAPRRKILDRGSGAWMLLAAAACFAASAWVLVARSGAAPEHPLEAEQSIGTAPRASAVVSATSSGPARGHAPESAVPSASPPKAPATKGVTSSTVESEPLGPIVAPIKRGAPLPHGVKAATVDYLSYLAMDKAQHCHAEGHAVGRANVYMTFAPSGRVDDVRIEGEPIASAPVSRCILEYARSVVLPKFDGPPFTIVRRVRLH